MPKTIPNKLYQMYLYLVHNHFATTNELSDLFNVNRKTILRWISKLRQSGLVSIKRTNRGYFVEGYKEWDESLAAQTPVSITSYKAMKEEFYRWKEEMEKQGTCPSLEDVINRFKVTEKTAKRWLQSEKSHFATLNGSHASNVRRAVEARRSSLGLQGKGERKEKSHFPELPIVPEKSHLFGSLMEKSHAGKSPIQHSGFAPAHAEKSQVREKSHSGAYTDHISIQRYAISPAGRADGTFPRMAKNGKLMDLRKAALWIRENVDAVEFIQNMGVTLDRPRGGSREWAGHCPLHDDRRPSFYVNADSGFWYCHACGVGGDLVELVRRIHGLRFGEAIRWILSRLSSVQPKTKQISGNAVPGCGVEEKRQNIESHAKRNEADTAGYLEQRGILPETAREYGLSATKTGEVEIPLLDRDGNRVGSLYRSVADKGGYHQIGSAALFGIPQALRKLRESGQDTLYVVEGPFDAMSIHQAGFPSVAIMRAGLTRKQVQEIRETFGDVRIVLIPDNDQAGWSACKENKRLLEQSGFKVKVGRIPAPYKDANEYLAEKARNCPVAQVI